jgi:heterodisulfide reductase subunit B
MKASQSLNLLVQWLLMLMQFEKLKNKFYKPLLGENNAII